MWPTRRELVDLAIVAIDFLWLVGQQGLLVLTLAFLAASQFVLSYQVAYVMLVRVSGAGRSQGVDLGFGPDSDQSAPAQFRGGIAIMVLNTVLAFNWVVPLVAFYVAYWYHVYWCPWELRSGLKGLMQATGPFELRELGYEIDWPGTGRSWDRGRPRVCPKCGSLQSDRVYHCSDVNKCLPLYNHFCPALRAPVFLANMRHYLFFLWAVSWHSVFCIGVSIWTLTQPQFRQMIAGPVWCLLLSVVPITYAVMILVDKARYLACCNLLGAEAQWNHRLRKVEPKGVWLAVRYFRRDETILEFVWCPRNPWNLGIWQNLEQVLGSWGRLSPFLWFFVCFWVPERVSRYGRYRADIGDLPWGPKGHFVRNSVLRQNLGRDSSSGQSTGYEV